MRAGEIREDGALVGERPVSYVNAARGIFQHPAEESMSMELRIGIAIMRSGVSQSKLSLMRQSVCNRIAELGHEPVTADCA